MTDEGLMAQLMNGDGAALAELYDRYAPRLLGLIMKILGDRADAEDVLQQVFWHIWCRRDRYDPGLASPAVWMMLIARSRSVDQLRRRGRRPEVTVDPGSNDFADPDGAPADVSEPVLRSRQALAQLPIEQREAVCLAFYRGLTHPQIADSQQVPLGTVKTRIRLGMIRMRTLLESQNEVSRP